jgi:uncharacterized protein YecT (DUF1311 family)
MQGRYHRTLLIAASLITLLLGSRLSAQENCSPLPVLDRCTADTERELAACVQTELRSARDTAHALFDDIAGNARAEEPALASLLDEELQGWLALSSKQCEIDTYHSRGGTAHGLYLDACLANQYCERATRLQQMLDNP